MNERVADILSIRLAAATAYQMLDHAQGYFDLSDYGNTVGLAWYSDSQGHWSCALKYGREEDDVIMHEDHIFEVAGKDKDALQTALVVEIQMTLGE